MRRALACVLMVLAACTTPPIRLSPRAVAGDRRIYALETEATTRIDLGGRARTQRTSLRARSTVDVLGVQGDETTIRVTLAPESFIRDGTAATTPAEQHADLALGPDGSVRRVVSVGGLPPELAGADVSEIVPLLGARLPTRRLHVGDRWRTDVLLPAQLPSPGGAPAPPLPPGVEQGRIAGLRVVGGYDCAVVALASRLPVVRERTVAGQQVRLIGTQLSQSEIAFAFREGFPVRIHTAAEADLGLQSGTFAGGRVTVRAETTLRLVSAQVG